MELKVTIKDPVGLHARPTSIIVQEANKFESEIKVVSQGREANLKSIMSVMALGVKTEEEITVIAEGSDAEAAIASIESVMKENSLI